MNPYIKTRNKYSAGSLLYDKNVLHTNKYILEHILLKLLKLSSSISSSSVKKDISSKLDSLSSHNDNILSTSALLSLKSEFTISNKKSAGFIAFSIHLPEFLK